MKTINQIAQEIQNVQIYPSTTRVEPNDKVTKLTFNFNAETYEELITGNGFNVIETKRHKKFGEITSSFKIRSIYNEPLTEFDRAVLAVCTSEMCAGNLYTTPSIIYRGLTGKIGKGDAKPHTNQLNVILHSVKKLMGTKYTSKIADAFKILGYGDGDIVIARRHRRHHRQRAARRKRYLLRPRVAALDSRRRQKSSHSLRRQFTRCAQSAEYSHEHHA